MIKIKLEKLMETITICSLLLLGLTGCSNKIEIGKKSDVEIIDKGVTLSIKDGTLTKTSATIIIKNNSDIDIQYGNPYEIEIKQNNEWYKINVELNFTLPAFSLKSKETKELELNWGNGYGKLEHGEYRIIKNIDIEKEDGTYEIFYISAEFRI